MKRVFIGLGNPGETYAHTYHNAGRMALDEIVREMGLGGGEPWKRHRDYFEYLEADGAIFVHPLTFMNDSGRAVREASKKFSGLFSPAQLFVLHDDSDITIGEYKISFARSSAGHKGVQSIIDALRTNAFTRIRIGIRPAREKHRQKAGEFALKQVGKQDREKLLGVFAAIRKALPGLTGNT